MIKLIRILILAQLFLLSCSVKKSDIIGKYSAINYVNTKDTITLLEEGIYRRSVYDNKDSLGLYMEGKWNFSEDMLTMHSFFLNLDRDLVAYPELVKDTTMRMECLLEKDGLGFKFCTGYRNNQNCYRQVLK